MPTYFFRLICLLLLLQGSWFVPLSSQGWRVCPPFLCFHHGVWPTRSSPNTSCLSAFAFSHTWLVSSSQNGASPMALSPGSWDFLATWSSLAECELFLSRAKEYFKYCRLHANSLSLLHFLLFFLLHFKSMKTILSLRIIQNPAVGQILSAIPSLLTLLLVGMTLLNKNITSQTTSVNFMLMTMQPFQNEGVKFRQMSLVVTTTRGRRLTALSAQ